MAISFVGAGTINGGPGTATPGLPAGATTGDDLFLLVESPNNAPVGPAGWILIDAIGTGTAGGVAATRLALYWTTYDSARYTAPTLTGAGDHLVTQILAWRDVEHDGLPYDVMAEAVAASATTAVSFPSLTTTVANTVVALMMSWATDTISAQASGWTNANLGSLTERSDEGSTSGNGGGFSTADGTRASPGSIGATTALLATSSVQALMSMALRPSGSYTPLTPPVTVTKGADTGNTTSRSITLPTVNSGDTLIVAFATDGTPTVTWDNSTAGTWTSRVNAAGGSDARLVVQSKTCDGTEGGKNLTIGTSASETAYWAIFRIQSTMGNIEVGSVAIFGSNTQNLRPASPLTPSWGAKDTIWLGLTGRDGVSSGTTLPPMYTCGDTSDVPGGGGAGATVDYGYCQYNTLTFDWGGVSMGLSGEQGASVLLAIEPAGGSSATPVSASATTTPASSLLRQIGKLARITTTPVSSLRRVLARPIAAATTPVSRVLKALTKSALQTTTSPAALLGRASGRVALITTSPVSTLAALKSLGLNATASTSAVADLIRQLITHVRWDNRVDVANTAYSNSDRVATSLNAYGRSLGVKPMLGKNYSELKIVQLDGASPMVGVSDEGWKNGGTGYDWIGASHAIGAYENAGAVHIGANEDYVGTIGFSNMALGDVLRIAEDEAAGLVWLAWNTGYYWNDNASADPETGDGGLSTAALNVGSRRHAALMPGVGVGVQVNAGSLPFDFAVPAGFSGQDASSPSPLGIQATTTPAASASRAAGKLARATTTPAPGLRRGVGKALASTSTPAAASTRSTTKTVLTASTPMAAFGRALGRALRAATTPQATVSALKVFLRSVLAASTPVTRLARQIGKGLAAATTPAVALARQAVKVVRATVTPAMLAARSTARVLSATTTPVASAAALKVFLRSVQAATTVAASLARTPGKALAVSVVMGVALGKAAARTIRTLAAASATLAKGTGRTIAASTTPLRALGRSAVKPILASSTPSARLVLSIGKLVCAAVEPMARIARQFVRNLLASAQTIPTLVLQFGSNLPVPPWLRIAMSGVLSVRDALSGVLKIREASSGVLTAREPLSGVRKTREALRGSHAPRSDLTGEVD